MSELLPEDRPDPAKKEAETLSSIAKAVQPLLDRWATTVEHSTRWTAYLGFALFAVFFGVSWLLIEHRQWDLVLDITKIFGSAAAGYALGALKKSGS